MDKTLVSVLVTSYNKGSWLADCLWSIFSQTHKPIEVIVCDNGSTDQSLDIINSFSKVPGFIAILYDKKMSSAWALQRCLEEASGEWIVKLDADDIIDPTHIEYMLIDAKAFDADMVYGDFIMRYSNGPEKNVETTADKIFSQCTIGLSSAIVKRSIANEVGGFDESMTFSEDWEFIVRMIKSGKKVFKGKRTGYIYRIVDQGSEAIMKGVASSSRIESHKYLRKKHNLPGPCCCGGCGTPEFAYAPKLPDGVSPRISASMIVKDEEEVLENCLKSIFGIDEIVILDTGSTDRTAEIAKKYTDKYIEGEYKWNDNFAEARNESLKRCTGDWILIIDADERLEEGGVQKIRDVISRVPQNIVALGFETISENKALKHDSVRLFRNNIGIVWHGAVHNYLSARSQLSSGITLYYGYSPAHAKDPDRAMRILMKEVEKDPDCLRERFYLAREFFYRRRWEEAVEHYKTYLEKAHWAPEKAEAWMQVCRCYANVGMIFEARLACLRALEINVDFKDALNTMAMLTQDQAEANRWREYAAIAKNTNTLFCTVEK